MKYVIQIPLLCLIVIFHTKAIAATYTVTPNTDVATIRNALSACSAGDTLIVNPGDYGTQQYIGNYQPDGEVTIVFPSQTWFESVLQLVNCQNLTITNLWHRLPAGSTSQPCIRITGSSSKHITIRHSRIDAQNAKNAIEITGNTELPENWPNEILIEHIEAFASVDDLIRVNGANHITIRDSHLRDPSIISGDTSVHIDAIQVIRARSIRILDNWITFVESAPNYQRNEGTGATNPHQGIILSTINSQTISHFEVRGNHFVDWTPGTPIIVSGAGVSDGIVYGNTLVNCVDSIVFGESIGTGISSFANFTESSQ